MIVNKSYQFIKTISYADSVIVKEKARNLEMLKGKTFMRIKIPDFTFNVYKNVISIHMEFIKGEVLNKHNKLLTNDLGQQIYKNIIWEDLVKKPDPFSAAGYHPSNFIVSEKNNELYYVDLEDMRFIDHKERMIKFKKDFLK
tara:strand:+ start:531 stop:956 length:426 start_codon:yes stop_codon:yes gene_type:complete